ncbi:MAG: cob(I)yrinic acid a,c-diamide adenosyltransferase [Bacteroidales bacterium]|nr:cob(I)yrinic acid a,c-diamide adenosyltransferase [Bacteroidales bacterium]
MKGYIQIYTGNGKGKTTAAIGLAIRAAGHNKNCFIGQFMKGREYGELKTLQKIPQIEIEQFGITKCITKEEVSEEYKEKSKKALLKCESKMLSGKYEIIVLDEINVSVWFGLINEKDVLDLIAKKPENVELILTGRYAPESIIEKADLVTEMKIIKHYYDKGVNARNGIEK